MHDAYDTIMRRDAAMGNLRDLLEMEGKLGIRPHNGRLDMVVLTTDVVERIVAKLAWQRQAVDEYRTRIAGLEAVAACATCGKPVGRPDDRPDGPWGPCEDCPTGYQPVSSAARQAWIDGEDDEDVLRQIDREAE